MSTFGTVGKKIDDRIEDFRRKIREAVDGLDESLKSADRQGFERAIKLAEAVAANAPYPMLAEKIRKIPYTSE